MRLLIWSAQYMPYIGGLSIMAHSLVVQLRREGHEVMVISNHAQEPTELSIDGIKVFLFPFERALAQYDFPSIRAILGGVDRIFDEFSPEVVNIHGWLENFSFYQIRVLEKRNVPFCITIHGLLEQTNCKRGNQCFSLLSMAQAANTVSNALMNSLVKECRVKHSLLRVIHNGMIVPKIPLQPLPVGTQKLVMVGRLAEEKCFDVAFRAVALLIKKYQNLKLVVLGEGELFDPLQKLRTSLGMESVIEMVGAVRPDRVYRFIDEANIVLIPSFYESFSLTALEAAIRARPVIASNVQGLQEVVEHRQSGLLIEPQNPLALGEAIDGLLSDTEEMKRMGEAARTRATSLFNIEKCARNYIEMYQQMVV